MPKVIDFTALKLEPLFDAKNARMINVKLPNSVTYAKGTILGELSGTNELWKLTISGGPTGGTFTMTYGGQTTAAIPYNAGAADVQAALEALSNVAPGDVYAYGGNLPGGIIYIEGRGNLAASNLTAPTTTDSLTGGSTPATAVTTVRNGAAGTPGTFKAYDGANTDGSQFARVILVYDVAVDASGNHFLGGQASNEYGESYKAAPAYYAGTFKTDDLTGLDQNAVQQLGRLVSGTTTSGILRVG